MRLRNKKTMQEGNFIIDKDHFECVDLDCVPLYFSLSELLNEWEDYKPADPLIKDKKIRKAVRAWAEANNFSVFRVNNQHFNYVKIHGAKDRYDPNGSNIEFMGTIAGAEKRTYEIDELCGEEEE